ncbi:hypothetical protein [Idiomarina abyssalis]|uniref:Uncharacterized protein n=1 Tax=Idiomarina abyssalis TaxID=86102 RepID=A0A8I1KHH8_9GAMM|nr:hypothetical protein [Idiomarina abyssalis]MBJ7265508.1 hypothetical protein [Idiomarina abyssalis]MBJ7316818.1 hypothetical protein [Idiomarina abyssalis]
MKKTLLLLGALIAPLSIHAANDDIAQVLHVNSVDIAGNTVQLPVYRSTNGFNCMHFVTSSGAKGNSRTETQHVVSYTIGRVCGEPATLNGKAHVKGVSALKWESTGKGYGVHTLSTTNPGFLKGSIKEKLETVFL